MVARSIRFTSLAMLALMAVACQATGHDAPPGSASAPASPAPVHAPAKPLWPDNGIAQRKFDAGANMTMFVEEDHGTRRAWVLSAYSKRIDSEHAWAEALDFFSGKVIKVKVVLEEDGHESQAFIDSTGDVHVYTTNPRFPFSGTAWGLSLPGLNFAADNVFLSGTDDNCYVSLPVTAPVKNYVTGQVPPVTWQKLPIYHVDTGGRACPSGFLHSMVGAALDLGDGTFLADEGCFVFRLRKSDLSPVGVAPALRVVDASVVRAAIAKLHGKKFADATGYLIKALDLPTSPGLSCKAD